MIISMLKALLWAAVDLVNLGKTINFLQHSFKHNFYKKDYIILYYIPCIHIYSTFLSHYMCE